MSQFKPFIIIIFLSLSTTLLAQLPTTLNYQGILKTAEGNIVPDGTYEVTFKLYFTETGDVVKWEETHELDIQNGIVDVVLGSITPIKIKIASTPLWLGITIGTGEELHPLIKLNSVPFSLSSQAVYGEQNVFPSRGNVLIGKANSSDRLVIRGANGGIQFPDGSFQKTAYTSEGALVLPYSAEIASTSTALEIVNNGEGSAILGLNHTGNMIGPFNTGILGTDSSGVTGTTGNTITNMMNYGVYGENYLAKNYGVLGGYIHGVFGKNKTSGNIGGLGNSNYGVYGYSASGFAGYFSGKVKITNRLGIDTDTPQQKLEIYNGYLSLNGPASGSEGIVFYETSAKKWSIVFRNWKNDNLAIRDETINSDIITFNGGTGNIGVGVESPTEKFQVAGNVKCKKLIISGGSDFAEPFDLIEQKIQPGMLVSINTDNPGKLEISKEAYDRKVAGVVSGGGGIKPGIVMKQEETITDGKNPISLSGRVYCYADATYGAIEPGDLLTTSDTPGYAMKVTNYNKAQGAIIGKAMSKLKSGKGMILILVTLQ